MFPRLLKSAPAGFEAALMLNRPGPEFVLALANRLDAGIAVVVAAVESAGLLDPKRPPEEGFDKLLNMLVGAVVVGVSWADVDAALKLPKASVPCC